MWRRLALLTVFALAVPAAADAHSGANGSYTSTVTAVRPPVEIVVSVTGGDDRLRLENGSGREVVIDGYAGEPYLRFAPGGVFENVRSPAAYLNRDRWAQTEVPGTASESDAPRWRKVADGDTYEWFDHRIHWMSQTQSPPAVQEEPDAEHRVFTWQVPGRAGNRAFTVAGTLDYAPGDRFPWVFVAIFITLFLALGLALLVFVRRRIRRA